MLLQESINTKLTPSVPVAHRKQLSKNKFQHDLIFHLNIFPKGNSYCWDSFVDEITSYIILHFDFFFWSKSINIH